jgi:hypothetical protein
MSMQSPAGAPLRSAALTRVRLRGFWGVSLIVSQKRQVFCPLDKLHTSVSYSFLGAMRMKKRQILERKKLNTEAFCRQRLSIRLTFADG